MRIIDIDKFRDTTDVSISGKQYSVNVVTVDEYINGNTITELENARKQGLVEYCKKAIEYLLSRSNIPENVLCLLTPRQLEAIILATQGVDPELLRTVSGGDGGK